MLTKDQKETASAAFRSKLQALRDKRFGRKGKPITLADALGDLTEAHDAYVALLLCAPSPPPPRVTQVQQLVATVGAQLAELKRGLPEDADQRDELTVELDNHCAGLLRHIHTRAFIPFDQPAAS